MFESLLKQSYTYIFCALNRLGGILLSFLLLLFMGIACTKDEPAVAKTNTITLSSQTFGSQPYYSMGYSFEKKGFYQRLSSGSEIDIYLAEVVNPMGDLIAVQFSTNTISESTFGFYLNNTFADSSAASEFYKNYTLAVFPEYSSLTEPIKEFQVYTFKTWKKNYVKFWIKEMRIFYIGDRAEYFDVDIEFLIQRDGSDNLLN